MMKDFKTELFLVGAHGGYSSMNVPLGGGATVFECLVESYRDRSDLQLEILSPGPIYPALNPFFKKLADGKLLDLHKVHPASLGYLQYARFSRIFEMAATNFLLTQNPTEISWVIVNDLCEGPNVEKLKSHGYRVITLVHVDVVDFTNNLYLKRWIAPEHWTAFWRCFRRMGLSCLTPDILKLIFDKQESAYMHSDYIVVPSEGMKETIMRCYPSLASEKIIIIPWGIPLLQPTAIPSNEKLKEYRQRWKLTDDAPFILLTLSRISPEKGIDRLLRGLLDLERSRPDLAAKCHLLIAGDAAYMDGPQYLQQLQKLVASFKKVKVTFTGHLVGEAKACAFELANLYAFLSRHESYGLTLAEARAAGLPCLVSQEVPPSSLPDDGIIRVDTAPVALAQQLESFIQSKPHGKIKDNAIPYFHVAAKQLSELFQR